MRCPPCAGQAAAVAVFGLMMVACGQKGPPLEPLRLVPAAVNDVSLRRFDDQARLRFVLPTRNANGPGRIELDRVEIFAVTVAPGSQAPPNRDLLTKAYLVGQIAVRPAPVEGETPAADDDARPAPGELATFEEVLTDEKLMPVAFTPQVPDGPPLATPPDPAVQGTATPGAVPMGLDPITRLQVEKPVAPVDATTAGAEAGAAPPTESGEPAAGAPPPAAAPAAPDAAVRKDPVRIYVARGVTRGGRPGPPSARVELPVVPVPPPPSGLDARVTEQGVVLEWTPPDAEPGLSFNVYEGDDDLQPVNPKPLEAASFEHPMVFGAERCYRVRSARLAGAVLIEGAPSEAFCLTPKDVFPPAAPAGLAAVSTPGQISLIWDANTEPDLAGYLILRGEAPDGALHPLVEGPVRETSYRDTTVVSGVRYVYAVVAVDTASPPNMSAMSPRVEETAR
jgi:hypothetical protein